MSQRSLASSHPPWLHGQLVAVAFRTDQRQKGGRRERDPAEFLGPALRSRIAWNWNWRPACAKFALWRSWHRLRDSEYSHRLGNIETYLFFVKFFFFQLEHFADASKHQVFCSQPFLTERSRNRNDFHRCQSLSHANLQ